MTGTGVFAVTPARCAAPPFRDQPQAPALGSGGVFERLIGRAMGRKDRVSKARRGGQQLAIWRMVCQSTATLMMPTSGFMDRF